MKRKRFLCSSKLSISNFTVENSIPKTISIRNFNWHELQRHKTSTRAFFAIDLMFSAFPMSCHTVPGSSFSEKLLLKFILPAKAPFCCSQTISTWFCLVKINFYNWMFLLRACLSLVDMLCL